jgi:hypothetical protein
MNEFLPAKHANAPEKRHPACAGRRTGDAITGGVMRGISQFRLNQSNPKSPFSQPRVHDKKIKEGRSPESPSPMGCQWKVASLRSLAFHGHRRVGVRRSLSRFPASSRRFHLFVMHPPTPLNHGTRLSWNGNILADE